MTEEAPPATADARLIGRGDELALLDRLLVGVSAGRGGALVIRGEPGIGKTALLNAVVRKADQQGMRVLTAAGVESESRLPYAALHQLLHPLTAEIAGMPTARRSPLLAAFGLEDGQPDLYTIALSVLELVVDLALIRPVMVAIDDLHWLDTASADVLAFVARRVGTEAVLLIGATRTVSLTDPLRRSGLPDLQLGRLAQADAAALLDLRAPQLSEPIRRRLLIEAAGNPLALVELPKTMAGKAMSGASDAFALNARLEAAFAARVDNLNVRTNILLVALAADANCDLRRLLAAAGEAAGQTVTLRDVQEAIDAGLVELSGTSLRFKHPLMRSAIYQRATVLGRLNAHRTLADQLSDFPDRRLWHLASATLDVDEVLATQLRDYAERARQRGATMSAVAALRRAAELSDQPAVSIALVLRAAELASEIGARHEVEQLLSSYDLSALRPIEHARLTNVMEVVRYSQYSDPIQRVRELTDIAVAAHNAGSAEVSMQLLWRAASRCFFQATGPQTAEARQRIADLVSVVADDAYDPQALAILAYTVPELQGREVLSRLDASATSRPGPDTMRFLGSAALVLGDFARCAAFIDVAVADARTQGRLGVLPRLLGGSNWGRLWVGQWDKAFSELNEAHTLAQETGEAFYAVASRTSIATITAMRGQLDEAKSLLDDVASHPLSAGMRYIQVAAAQARGLIHLFEGAPQDAFRVLAQTFDPAEPSYHRYMRWWLVPDLLDAAIAARRVDEARALIADLPGLATQVGAPIVVVAAAYAGAALDSSDATYASAMSGELGQWPLYRARLQLHAGRRMRRAHQAARARDLLRSARDTFDTLGAVPWADAARAELRAAGESSQQRVTSARETLSPQELQIASMAANGLTNREIAERLFLSHRTVGSHLYRIYPRLGITRRAQLASVLLDP